VNYNEQIEVWLKELKIKRSSLPKQFVPKITDKEYSDKHGKVCPLCKHDEVYWAMEEDGDCPQYSQERFGVALRMSAKDLPLDDNYGFNAGDIIIKHHNLECDWKHQRYVSCARCRMEWNEVTQEGVPIFYRDVCQGLWSRYPQSLLGYLEEMIEYSDDGIAMLPLIGPAECCCNIGCTEQDDQCGYTFRECHGMGIVGRDLTEEECREELGYNNINCQDCPDDYSPA